MWVVKVPVRVGNDVVVSKHDSQLLAEETAYQYNFAYDTDIYYVEEVDNYV